MSIYLYLDMSPCYVIFSKASHWPSDCGKINQAAAHWQEKPGSSPLTGSTRQQTVGRINQVAVRGYEDEDEDEDEDKDQDKDEILSYAVLLTASVKRFCVSRMRDFFCIDTMFTKKSLHALYIAILIYPTHILIL